MNEDVSSVTSFEKRVNALTINDIQMVAKKYLTNGFILGILNPED